MTKSASLLLLAFPLVTGCTVHTYSGGRPPPRTTVVSADGSAAAGWEQLGVLTVNGSNDRDSLPVGRSEGLFAALRIHVNNSALRMHNIVVVFADGTTYSPDTRLVFNAGSTSSVIDLPGTRRAIRRVDFRYTDLAGGGRAQVEVWGR